MSDNSVNSGNKANFWNSLLYPKGTVAEPWPTVTEVLNDTGVQERVGEVKKAFEDYKKKSNKSNANGK